MIDGWLETCCTAQAFLTEDYLAIAMEHTHSGTLAQFVTSKSLGTPGMGLSEDIARSGHPPSSVPHLRVLCWFWVSGMRYGCVS